MSSTLLATFLGLDNDGVKTIGAVATSVGVLVALFAPAWTRWWRAPLLSMEYEAKQGDPHWDHVSIVGKSFFLRVRIRNARGCNAAKDVEVIVTAFRSDVLGLDERSLEWSGQRARDREPITKMDLAPGLSRHVDLVQISPRSSSRIGLHLRFATAGSKTSARHDKARLCVYPKPWGAAHIVRTGDHDMELVVTAANADAVTYDSPSGIWET